MSPERQVSARYGPAMTVTAFDTLAIRSDLAVLATKSDLAAREVRMTWRIGGLVIAAKAVLVAAMRFLP